MSSPAVALSERLGPGILLDLSFRAEGNGLGCLGAGWSHPEAEWTWAVDHESTVALAWPQETEPEFLELWVEAVFGFHQALTLRLDGEVVGSVRLTQPSVFALPLPRRAGRGEVRHLSLEHTGARPVADVGGEDQRRLSVAVGRLRLLSAPPQPARPASLTRSLAIPADLRDLALQFESLGDNCEFGAVQRNFGVEVAGLFRWSSTKARMLVTLLDEELKSVDDPESVRLELSGLEGRREYLAVNDTLGTQAHVSVGESERDIAAAAQVLSQIGVLKRKMLEDLRTGRKTFVFRTGEPHVSGQELSLWLALRRHGPNGLLWIQPKG